MWATRESRFRVKNGGLRMQNQTGAGSRGTRQGRPRAVVDDTSSHSTSFKSTKRLFTTQVSVATVAGNDNPRSRQRLRRHHAHVVDTAAKPAHKLTLDSWRDSPRRMLSAPPRDSPAIKIGTWQREKKGRDDRSVISQPATQPSCFIDRQDVTVMPLGGVRGM